MKFLPKILLVSAMLVTAIPVVAIGAGTQNQQELISQARSFAANYDEAYPKALAAWPGFDPKNSPKLIVMRDKNGRATSLISVDHPNVTRLGDAVPIQSQQGTIHVVTNLKHSRRVNKFENFEFSTPIAGVDTFLIASSCVRTADPFDCASSKDFTAFVLHEVFHRYQNYAFGDDNNYPNQDKYDYRPEFIYATLIENGLLAKAATETDVTVLTGLARKIVGVRAYRASESKFVALDESQERFEGTAQFVENQMTPAGTRLAEGALGTELFRGEVKEELGFGRFYTTGAVLVETAIKLGIPEVQSRIEGGQSPMQVLASVYNSNDQAAIFAAAVKQIDPSGNLKANARKYAKWAKTEPGVFDE